MAKKFVWLRGDEVPRKGPPLRHNEEHAAADYPAHVVEWWVESGAAKLVESKPKKEKG